MLDDYIGNLENLMLSLMETADTIEDTDTYKEKLTDVIKKIEHSINLLFQLFSDEEIAAAANFDRIYILQMLQDLLHAMENEDKVLLVDVLRFGFYTEMQKACLFLKEINENPEEV